MLVVPYIRLLILGLLATLVPLIDAKGGGGHGSGGKGSSAKGSSSSGSKSGSKSKISKVVVHTNGSSHTECRNEETGEIAKCPKDKKAGIIAGAVIGSVLGLLLIGGLIYWFVRRRRRNKGQTVTRSLTIPFIAPAKKKEYKPIESDPEHEPPKTKFEGTV